MTTSANDILNARLAAQGLDVTDQIKALALEEAERVILNYCSRTVVPYQLNFVWAGIAQDIIEGRYSRSARSLTDAISDNEVESITAGDMTIKRGADLTTHKINLDNLTAQYRKDLDAYRLINWGHDNGCGGWF